MDLSEKEGWKSFRMTRGVMEEFVSKWISPTNTPCLTEESIFNLPSIYFEIRFSTTDLFTEMFLLSDEPYNNL